MDHLSRNYTFAKINILQGKSFSFSFIYLSSKARFIIFGLSHLKTDIIYIGTMVVISPISYKRRK